MHLVDTPGFDDTTRKDSDILREISAWLSESYTHKVLLNGILYLHRISDPRMQGSGKMRIDLLLKLCGKDSMKKVVLTTTMWEKVEQSVGDRREEELINTEEFWGFMKRKGSQTRRHYNNKQSALNIVGMFVPDSADVQPETMTLDIQKELADEHKTLDQTSAGQLLGGTWAKEENELQREIEEVRDAVQTARGEQDMHLASLLQEQQDEMDRTVERMRLEQEKLRVTMEELHAERLGKMQEMLRQQMKVTRSLSDDLESRDRLQRSESALHQEARLRNQQQTAEQQRTIDELAAKLSSIQVPEAGPDQPPPWSAPTTNSPSATSPTANAPPAQETQPEPEPLPEPKYANSSLPYLLCPEANELIDHN